MADSDVQRPQMEAHPMDRIPSAGHKLLLVPEDRIEQTDADKVAGQAWVTNRNREGLACLGPFRVVSMGPPPAAQDPDPVPVLYLDLDGTVRQGKDDALGRFVNGPEDVVVFAEATEMMRRWKRAGGRIIGVSNQGGVALGLVPYAKVADAMRRTYTDTEQLFDMIAFCCHHPRAQNPAMARCWCRKPLPGLIIDCAHKLGERIGEYYPPYMGLMVGDRPEDQECARLAGLDFQWAAEWRAQAKDSSGPVSP